MANAAIESYDEIAELMALNVIDAGAAIDDEQEGPRPRVFRERINHEFPENEEKMLRSTRYAVHYSIVCARAMFVLCFRINRRKKSTFTRNTSTFGEQLIIFNIRGVDRRGGHRLTTHIHAQLLLHLLNLKVLHVNSALRLVVAKCSTLRPLLEEGGRQLFVFDVDVATLR